MPGNGTSDSYRRHRLFVGVVCLVAITAVVILWPALASGSPAVERAGQEGSPPVSPSQAVGPSSADPPADPVAAPADRVPAASAVSVRGCLLWPSGAPVEEARVEIAATAPVLTGPDGRFQGTMPGSPAGPVDLKVLAPGWSRARALSVAGKSSASSVGVPVCDLGVLHLPDELDVVAICEVQDDAFRRLQQHGVDEVAFRVRTAGDDASGLIRPQVATASVELAIHNEAALTVPRAVALAGRLAFCKRGQVVMEGDVRQFWWNERDREWRTTVTAAGLLGGAVRDERGQPLAAAVVKMVQPRSDSPTGTAITIARTGADGRFLFLPSAAFAKVSASCRGVRSAEHEILRGNVTADVVIDLGVGLGLLVVGHGGPVQRHLVSKRPKLFGARFPPELSSAPDGVSRHRDVEPGDTVFLTWESAGTLVEQPFVVPAVGDDGLCRIHLPAESVASPCRVRIDYQGLECLLRIEQVDPPAGAVRKLLTGANQKWDLLGFPPGQYRFTANVRVDGQLLPRTGVTTITAAESVVRLKDVLGVP